VVATFQAQLIRQALKQTGGVQRKAARLLQLSPTTLNEMVHRFELVEGSSKDKN
jgi:transcriptional regulator with GAF, ATPase, and Fis domain